MSYTLVVHLGSNIALHLDGILDSTVQIPDHLQHIPRSNRITARQINDISHSQKMSERRESRCSADITVIEALADISTKENSLSRATTQEDVENAHQVRMKARDVLRPFETTKARQKDLHTQDIRTKRAWTKVGAAERARIQNHVLETLTRKLKL